MKASFTFGTGYIFDMHTKNNKYVYTFEIIRLHRVAGWCLNKLVFRKCQFEQFWHVVATCVTSL